MDNVTCVITNIYLSCIPTTYKFYLPKQFCSINKIINSSKKTKKQFEAQCYAIMRHHQILDNLPQASLTKTYGSVYSFVTITYLHLGLNHVLLPILLSKFTLKVTYYMIYALQTESELLEKIRPPFTKTTIFLLFTFSSKYS